MGMEDILQAILGGAAAQQGRSTTQSRDPLADLLEGMMGGAKAQPQRVQPQASPSGGLEDILGGILGGAGGMQPQTQPQAMPGGLGDILGGILGGAQGQQAQPASGGGLGDILGAILGGGGSNTGANAFLAPIADALSKKLGIPPALAMIVVTFLVGKLFSGRAQTGSAPVQPQRSGTRKTAQGSANLDHLLDAMNEGKRVETSQVRGMAKELAQQTGMDQKTAEKSLQETLQILGGQVQQVRRTRPSNASTPGGLDHLLDSW